LNKKNLRKKLAVLCARLAYRILRILPFSGGSTFPGYLAHRIAPDILTGMAGQIRRGIIVTIGTNGKTTANSLLCHVLRAQGMTVVCNRSGANMPNGILTAFLLAADKNGRIHADYACIEVDEFAAAQVLPQLKPRCILLTNIFRDQLDRYGEVDIVCEKLREAISQVPDAVLVANCDDPLSCSLTVLCGIPSVTYGISEQIFDQISRPGARESTFCRFCGGRLEYGFFHYGQLGNWRCPCCGRKRPVPDYTASDINFRGQGYSFDIGGIRIDSRAECPYNVYNTLSAYAALRALDIPTDKFRESVQVFDYGNRREETFTVNGARVQLHLAKNPIGFQQKISLILRDPAPKDIIIQINDTLQDGKDISWLWDVEFSHLRNANAAAVTTTGARRHDMALRLKYEDIPCTTARNLRKAVLKYIRRGTGNLYLIVNYSGLLDASRMLAKLQRPHKSLQHAHQKLQHTYKKTAVPH